MIRNPALLTIAALASALATGCGAQTRTVSISSNPPARSGGVSSATRTERSTSTGARETTTETAGEADATTSASSTVSATSTSTSVQARTSTAPAFLPKSAGEGSSLTSALKVLESAGYVAIDPSEFHEHQTLQVLIGRKAGEGGDDKQRAFFFLAGTYLGTDAAKPSASLKVISQRETEVTLGYRLYRPQDPLCCASGGEADVHFQLNNGELVALNPIPPVSSSTGLSRR